MTIPTTTNQEDTTPMFIDKVTLTGPRPYGGTFTTTTNDPTVARLVGKGYSISRVWTIRVNADGTRESLPLN